MSLRKGLARAGRTLDSPRKSLGKGVVQQLTLDSPAGWLTGEESIGMSRDRAMKISTVNRCVEVLSNSMAVLPVYIMNERTKERLPDHRLGRVLWERANEAMTAFDYQRLMLCNELLRGNAYAWIYRDPRTGWPRELIPLPPDYMTIDVDADGHVWYFFTHPSTGQVTMLRPEEILHYKAYSEDGIEGISVLRRASLTLSTARAAQQYENSTWLSGGQPSGILTTDSDLGDQIEVVQADGTKVMVDPKEQLRKSWEAVHRGPGNAFRIAVLDLGLKYQPISMTNSDAQFVESNEIRVADVCRFFGVPLHLAYAGKQSYQSNEQNGIEFVNYTLLAYALRKKTRETAKAKVRKKTGGYHKSFHKGKVYNYRGDKNNQAVRIYNTAPGAGAIEVGRTYKKKDGTEWFKPGAHVMETAAREFEPQYLSALDDLLDELADSI